MLHTGSCAIGAWQLVGQRRALVDVSQVWFVISSVAFVLVQMSEVTSAE